MQGLEHYHGAHRDTVQLARGVLHGQRVERPQDADDVTDQGTTGVRVEDGTPVVPGYHVTYCGAGAGVHADRVGVP